MSPVTRVLIRGSRREHLVNVTKEAGDGKDTRKGPQAKNKAGF